MRITVPVKESSEGLLLESVWDSDPGIFDFHK